MNSAAPVIIPRWEWRTFASSLAELRGRLGEIAFDAVRESCETYLLCLRSSHNAKIRGNNLQLKWRKQINADGLELWDPILQSTFPLDGLFVKRLLDVWGIERHVFGKGPFEAEAFLSEIVDRIPDLRAVPIQKRHEGFEVQGAKCKFTRILGLDEPFESFCIEHEDPEIVMQVIRELGLDTRDNINYPKGLKQVLGLNPTP
jgi:hypothetical protein